MIDRTFLLEGVRASLYKGKLRPGVQPGLNAIIDAWARLAPAADLRWIAYSLATAYHETACTFEPLREYGRGKGKKYGKPDPVSGHVYYGRGFVQLTWRDNYLKMGRKLGFDFVSNPDKVMDPKIAAEILVRGMVDGDFTTRSLGRYILRDKCDYVGARYIINGKDRAEVIAGYAKKFEACLRPIKVEQPAMVDTPMVEALPTSPAPVQAPTAPIAPVQASAASEVPEAKSVFQRVKAWFA